uniref:Uncharacterized protein n=1 Tax=Tetraselmis sp. GSL018 TaxID=582737 RepID=A0A061S034_9CHLO|mmetsp:Transcript_16966/g.40467  ORF Transcript_16966/g.40467 Transcript_16966/m.40467 type:complete len:513 (+) Transcript_16966:68-1606(+)|eukprot:CAMPEP_0177602536 /NCGR_PEP_ID=MMETSP0419_2-20121207/14928_1 /TAXON_ID=582737 /ORGANISM="Tetraselmis sp., Strain GSL018" /LENGTH=512 /DNA_ID=CAMNT_0019096041 /DNA_START=24 /DNA_END=1562 /DNA_ORIENTATION=-
MALPESVVRPPTLAEPPEYNPDTSKLLPGVATALGGPIGLSKVLLSGATTVPIRFWIVDNSGSMATDDGTRLVPSSSAPGNFNTVRSTRWEELRDVILLHARLAEALKSRIDIHLLNNPRSTQAPQFLSLGSTSCECPSVSSASNLQQLLTALNTQPTGTTPLTEAVQTVTGLIAQVSPRFRKNGQTAVVVLATDGLPDDPDSFVPAVVELQRLGCVWLVVRLCTNSQDVLDYWNTLDQHLEAPLEVLDDPSGEAASVYDLNPWLTYGLPLHTLRESGIQNKLFDLLDEKQLIGSQVAELCSLLFGCEGLPNPEVDWPAFAEKLGIYLSVTDPAFCPTSSTLKPWVNLQVLKRQFDKGRGHGLLHSLSFRGRLQGTTEYLQPQETAGEVLSLTFSAKKLAKKGFFGSVNPFCTVSSWCGEHGYALVANTETLGEVSKPQWRTMHIPRAKLSPWDTHGRLRLEVFDFDPSNAHRFIGRAHISVPDLLAVGTLKCELLNHRSRGSQGSLTVSVS